MENNNLPWWQVLSNWENAINTSSFISSLSTFYIKSTFATTNKRFIAHYPNIVLWFLPMWFNNLTFNLKQISSVNIDVEYKLLKMLLWIISIIIWLWTWDILWMIILILIWVIFLSLWIQVIIKISTSWWVTKCPIIFWEKSKAQNFINDLNSTVAENS